ncbi:MAG: class I SAM-dependent methyltransferase, partial [Candidatus Riflebacteria bacterium]|nr:class I SAM-dependent methyltransferase [Candidatus Riflebacteria bacterium]
MEPQVYQEIADLEDWHWWFVGTRRALLGCVLPGLEPTARVLDAGCGSGGTLR